MSQNRTLRGMKDLLVAFAFILPVGGWVFANDAPEPATDTTAQAQARQFGIFYGGTASQYDLCVKKGYLPKGDQSAEELAKSMLDKVLRASTTGPELFGYVQDGWDTMKQQISQHESFYTQERCSGVAREWVKMIATM